MYKDKNLFHALEGPRHVDAEANEGSDEKHAADKASLEAVPVIPVVEVGLRVRGSDLVGRTSSSMGWDSSYVGRNSSSGGS